MLDRETAEKLREIGLLGMAQTLAAQERDPEADSLSFAERFGLLVDAEWTCRRNRRLERLLRRPGSASRPASRISTSAPSGG